MDDVTFFRYDMAGWNPWNQPLATWKALLKPTPYVKGQTFTITAACIGCQGNITSETISNVVFGDMVTLLLPPYPPPPAYLDNTISSPYRLASSTSTSFLFFWFF